ncbi:Hypothetical_protein [Hexamita inflata]|uniref:Hypothetical_protein n=1 Tax=Hexamita inflata TaxID=28002 RepID=A0AA86RJ65_9EUKA|nr:Hypothetical protein HINF_LOCUS66605 [Hexamita inflata]
MMLLLPSLACMQDCTFNAQNFTLNCSSLDSCPQKIDYKLLLKSDSYTMLLQGELQKSLKNTTRIQLTCNNLVFQQPCIAAEYNLSILVRGKTRNFISIDSDISFQQFQKRKEPSNTLPEPEPQFDIESENGQMKFKVQYVCSRLLLVVALAFGYYVGGNCIRVGCKN